MRFGCLSLQSLGFVMIMMSGQVAGGLSERDMTRLSDALRQPAPASIRDRANSVPASLPTAIRQYPYRTAGLSLGKLKKKVIRNGPNQPICLIGYDRQSIAWLKQYDSQLKHVSAVCFLVSARSVTDADRIRQYVSVPVVPAPVNDLVQRFSLTRYPVLISRHLIEQGVWF